MVSKCLLQCQVVSEPLRLNGALDGLVLGGLQVFGVPSPPLYVLANGDKVRDFTYRSDTKVSSVWLSTTSFGGCLSQQDNDVILQIRVCMFPPVHVFIYHVFTHRVYCLYLYYIRSRCQNIEPFCQSNSLCVFPQVLTVTSLALPMSEVFTVQWALWCTELY